MIVLYAVKDRRFESEFVPMTSSLLLLSPQVGASNTQQAAGHNINHYRRANAMVDDIVTNGRSDIKGDSYKTAHESLCAKLQQTKTIANVAVKGNLTDGELFHVLWCLADLLGAACEQCECLKARDFASNK